MSCKAAKIDAYVDTSALTRRFGRVRALQFLAMIDDMPFLEVRPVGAADLRSASSELRRFTDQDLTLVAAVGPHCMRHGRVTSCWSTDRHLELTVSR